MKKELKAKTYTASWTVIPDPLYCVECPHCQATIFMSSPTVVQRLQNWAKKFKKGK